MPRNRSNCVSFRPQIQPEINDLLEIFDDSIDDCVNRTVPITKLPHPNPISKQLSSSPSVFNRASPTRIGLRLAAPHQPIRTTGLSSGLYRISFRESRLHLL